MEIRKLANSYLVLALILGALLPVMLSIATNMNTYEFLFLTYLIAVPASYAFVVFSGKKEKLLGYLRDKKSFATIAAIGLLNYAFLEFGLSYAERFVSASLATVVYRTYPILMLLFLPAVLKERISKYQVAALLLAFSGVYLALSGGGLSIVSAGSQNAGIVAFLVVVALAGALATVLVKRYMYDMESSMFIFNLANFVFFTLLFLAQGAPTSAAALSDMVPILYVGIVYNVFVGFMYYGALRMLKTTFVTNIYFLSPFITFIFSALILGEAIEPYYIAIAVLVTAGIVIQKLDKVGGTYLAKRSKRLKDFIIFDVSGAFANTGEMAISTAIRGGGRVLAMKLGEKHRERVHNLVVGGKHENVFTDKHEGIPQEVGFVKDILGAREGDMVVMKAGEPEDCERFFETLSADIGTEEGQSGVYQNNNT